MAYTSDNADDFLISRVEDAWKLSEKRGVPCFVGFMDQREQALATRFLRSKLPDDQYGFYGGYPEAERKFLAFYSPYFIPDSSEFPLAAMAFTYRKAKTLTHRDVLGTLMSIGLKRDALGDILCGDGIAVVFVRRELMSFISTQVDRIGGEGVSVVPDYCGELPISFDYEEISETIASGRLDVLVKTLTHISRESASELISVGAVSVDHLPVTSVSKTVEEGAVLSIRGYGRYHIDQIGPKTKKGRLLLLARRRL